MVQQDYIRKGSKVFFSDTKEEPVTVFDNVDGEISVKLSKMVTAYSDDLYPVPLSPEIIKRCGFFKTDEYVFEHPSEKIELEIDYKGVTHMHIHTHQKVLELKALHELQYAFWTYTNSEIIFK
jgi:uncharacterized protein YdeI (BOF family)